MDPQLGGWQNAASQEKSRRWSPARAIILLLAFIFIGVLALGIFGPSSEEALKTDPGEGLSFFGTEIIVQKDGSLTVTESTRAVLQGEQGRHGISRRLPSVLSSAEGTSVPLQYANQSASVAPVGTASLVPAPLPVTSLTDEENAISFRIGDKDNVLPKGAYDFSFRYTASGFVQNSKALKTSGFTWNLTGGIIHSITSSQLRIKLPDYIDPKTVSAKSFLGMVDSQEKAQAAALGAGPSPDVRFSIERSTDEREVFVSFVPKRPIRPLEQFIVEISWPEGFLNNGE